MKAQEKHLLGLAAVAAAAFGLLAGSHWPVLSAGAVKEVGIEFRDDEGNFFFKEGDADIEIESGDTVRWVADGGTHRMLADSPRDAFEETIDFGKLNPQERSFPKAVNIKYHCVRHPSTMVGTITVKAPGAEKAE